MAIPPRALTHTSCPVGTSAANSAPVTGGAATGTRSPAPPLSDP